MCIGKKKKEGVVKMTTSHQLFDLCHRKRFIDSIIWYDRMSREEVEKIKGDILKEDIIITEGQYRGWQESYDNITKNALKRYQITLLCDLVDKHLRAGEKEAAIKFLNEIIEKKTGELYVTHIMSYIRDASKEFGVPLRVDIHVPDGGDDLPIDAYIALLHHSKTKKIDVIINGADCKL